MDDETIMAVIREHDYMGHYVFVGDEGGFAIEPHTVSAPMSKRGAKRFARFLNAQGGVEALVLSGKEILRDEIEMAERAARWYR